MRIIILFPLQCHQQIPSFPPSFQHHYHVSLLRPQVANFEAIHPRKKCQMPISGVQAACFELPATNPCRPKGLVPYNIVQLALMGFECISNTTFFLIFETCQAYRWATARFQTRENSANGLQLGGIFAYVSVNGNLTLRFIENLSPGTWSSTEVRCM